METTCGGSSMSREVMKQALEALENDPISHTGLVSRKQAITALRQALGAEQKTAVSPGKGTGFNYFRAIESKLKEKNT